MRNFWGGITAAVLVALAGSFATTQAQQGKQPQPVLMECGAHGGTEILCGTRSPEDVALDLHDDYLQQALDEQTRLRGQLAQLRRRFGGSLILASVSRIIIPARQPHFDTGDFPNQAIAHNFSGLWEGRNGALPGAGLPDSFVAANRPDDSLLFSDGAGKRLLLAQGIGEPCEVLWRAGRNRQGQKFGDVIAVELLHFAAQGGEAAARGFDQQQKLAGLFISGTGRGARSRRVPGGVRRQFGRRASRARRRDDRPW